MRNRVAASSRCHKALTPSLYWEGLPVRVFDPDYERQMLPNELYVLQKY